MRMFMDIMHRIFILRRFHAIDPLIRVILLDVTPPKQVLSDDSLTLVQAHLVPMSIIYVGFNQSNSGNHKCAPVSAVKITVSLVETRKWKYKRGSCKDGKRYCTRAIYLYIV